MTQLTIDNFKTMLATALSNIKACLLYTSDAADE